MEALQYRQSTGLAMPIFADTYALMERRYEIDISLQNIYQTRIIDTQGKVTRSDLEAEAIGGGWVDHYCLANIRARRLEAPRFV